MVSCSLGVRDVCALRDKGGGRAVVIFGEAFEMPTPGKKSDIKLLGSGSTALVELEDLEQAPVAVDLPELAGSVHEGDVVPPHLSDEKGGVMEAQAVPVHLGERLEKDGERDT